MVNQLRSLPEKYDLMHCMIAFVKDENINLISRWWQHYIPLLIMPFETSIGLWRYVFWSHYDEKVIVGLKSVSVKIAQGNLQKTITWTKKLGKGKHEWQRACVERGLQPWKLKTLMKTMFVNKVIMFEKVLEFMERLLVELIHKRDGLCCVVCVCGLGGVGCGWGMKLVLCWARFIKKLRFNSPTSYWFFRCFYNVIMG